MIIPKFVQEEYKRLGGYKFDDRDFIDYLLKAYVDDNLDSPVEEWIRQNSIELLNDARDKKDFEYEVQYLVYRDEYGLRTKYYNKNGTFGSFNDATRYSKEDAIIVFELLYDASGICEVKD